MAIFTSTTSDLTPFRRAVNYRLGCSSGVRKGPEASAFLVSTRFGSLPSLIASLLVPVMRNLMLSRPLESTQQSSCGPHDATCIQFNARLSAC
jgi:hypothetical protein